MEDLTLMVKVRSREGLLFDGRVYAISSTNDIGPFDVLPLHANFVSVIQNFLIITLVDGSKKHIQVDKGLIRVRENKADIFLGI